MLPISKHLLIHSALLRRKAQTDMWQNSSYEDVPLTFVRVENKRGLLLTKDNTQTQLSCLLFFDLYHSRPIGTTFELGDEIEFAEHKYVVQSVEVFFDECKAHHVEVGLK